MLAYLYRKCESLEDKRLFYAGFAMIKNLVMWKAQFIQSDILLIKFGQPEYIINRVSDAQQGVNAFFVFYNLSSTEILAFHNNSSSEFLSTFFYDLDAFHERLSGDPCPEAFITNAANSYAERQELLNTYINVSSAKHGG